MELEEDPEKLKLELQTKLPMVLPVELGFEFWLVF